MNRPPIQFERIDHQFLEVSREWLGNVEFRDLIMAKTVDKDAQAAWFASLPHRTDYKIWGLKSSNEWIGACGLKNIDYGRRSAEYWGYIYPLDFRSKGLGQEMFHFLTSKAAEMKIKRFWLRVSSQNKSAIMAYMRWGFSRIPSDEHGIIRMEVNL